MQRVAAYAIVLAAGRAPADPAVRQHAGAGPLGPARWRRRPRRGAAGRGRPRGLRGDRPPAARRRACWTSARTGSPDARRVAGWRTSTASRSSTPGRSNACSSRRCMDVGGSTSDARWVRLDDLPTLDARRPGQVLDRPAARSRRLLRARWTTRCWAGCRPPPLRLEPAGLDGDAWRRASVLAELDRAVRAGDAAGGAGARAPLRPAAGARAGAGRRGRPVAAGRPARTAAARRLRDAAAAGRRRWSTGRLPAACGRRARRPWSTRPAVRGRCCSSPLDRLVAAGLARDAAVRCLHGVDVDPTAVAAGPRRRWSPQAIRGRRRPGHRAGPAGGRRRGGSSSATPWWTRPAMTWRTAFAGGPGPARRRRIR